MPRLPKGLRKRGNHWYARLFENGREREVALGPEYADACRKLKALRHGETWPATRMTVTDAATAWLQTYCAVMRSEQNLKLARRRAEMYLIPFFAHRDLSRVTSQSLFEYRVWLEQRGKQPQTVRHILSDARCLFTWAADTGLIVRSPVPKRLLPKIQERAPDRLTDDEVEKVLRMPEPYLFVIRLALATGMRWGELSRAQAAHFNGEWLILEQTKSGKVRRIPLPKDIAAEVRCRVGRLCPYTHAGAFARQVRRMTGVSRFHVHQLRHTFGCRWLERGGSLAALQQVLGHSTIVMTQRYAKLSDEFVMREATRIMGAPSGTNREETGESHAKAG